MAKKHDLGILLVVGAVALFALIISTSSKNQITGEGDGEKIAGQLFRGCRWTKLGGFDVYSEVKQDVLSCNLHNDDYDPYKKGYIKLTIMNTVTVPENEYLVTLRETMIVEDQCLDYSVLEEYSCANETISVKSTGICTHGCNKGRCNRVGKLSCSFPWFD